MKKIIMIKVGGLVALASLLLMLPAKGDAQALKDRLEAIKKEYSSLHSVHIQMSIKVYEDRNSEGPYFSEVADIKRHNYNFSYHLGSTDMLMNNKFIIMVDKEMKEILCTKRSLKDEKKLFDDPYAVNLDSIVNLYNNPMLINTSGKTEHYRLTQSNSLIKQIDMFIDGEENVLERLEYSYADNHYVVIEFLKFIKNPVFDDYVFNEAKYFSLVKGNLKPSSRYNGFHVMLVDGK